MVELGLYEKVGLVVAGVLVASIIEYVMRRGKPAEEKTSGSAPSAGSAIKALVEVEYCGGWGYDRYFHALKKEIDGAYGAQVDVQPLRNAGKTGNFEVRLKGGALELLHSKSSRGQGRCESQEEVDAVLEQIGAHLRGKKGN